MSVPTPTGVLQGVAAFNWDGAQWQPSGRAGPSVATPTGNLQGVAAFSGAPPQPTGRAGPGVATPTGVLDGVVVYTWSGGQWTPSGGQPAPSTPSGALRGVAAFDWDGAAWQPAGLAGPDVPTPYGVLQGVARFGWTGTAWAAAGAPSLSLDFMRPGQLDPLVSFTRASTATYTDTTGMIQTAAVNAPRWDYDPVTHALKGLLIEEARTNTNPNSGDVSNATWTKGGVGAASPVVTGNQMLAPDGTVSASRVAYPSVSGAGNYSEVHCTPIVETVAPYTYSIYLKGSVGGEQLYIGATPDGALYYRLPVTLTLAWRRFVFITPNLTAVPWYFIVGVDLRDAGQSSQPAQTIYAWGAQLEQGAFATSYIPTAGVTVTRAQDGCAISSANMVPWFASPGGSWFAEYICLSNYAGCRIVGQPVAAGVTPLYCSPTLLGQYDGVGAVTTVNGVVVGQIAKGASAYTGAALKACLSSGGVATAASTTGYGLLAGSGVRLLTTSPVAGSTDNMTGYIRRVQYWPRVLSDAEMQAVTT